MSPSKRADLIRQRFKTLYPSKVIRIPKSEKRPEVDRQCGFGGIMAGWFGNAEAWNWGKRDWLMRTEFKRNPTALSTKRIKRESPLTVISRKLKRGAVIWQKYRQ